MGGGHARRRARRWGKSRAGWERCRGGPGDRTAAAALPSAGSSRRSSRGTAASSELLLLSCPISWGNRGRHHRRLCGSPRPCASAPARPAVPLLPRQTEAQTASLSPELPTQAAQLGNRKGGTGQRGV